jgi:chemotaxis protein MotB
MGKKHKCKKCPECEAGEKWAVPTADFFSLLLALFIALFAIASTNKEKVKALKEEFVKIYDYAAVPEAATPVINLENEDKETGQKADNPDGQASIMGGGALLVGSASPTSETVTDVVEKIQKELKNASLSGSPLEQSVDGVLLKLPAFVPFNGTSASIGDADIQLFIKRVAAIINMLPTYVDVSVRGYTDNQPLPKDSAFRDNIDLSNQRAVTVMQELIKNGVSADRLSTAGFGSSKPVALNDTEENRAKNRRVEFYIFISNETPLDAPVRKNILDTLSELKK